MPHPSRASRRVRLPRRARRPLVRARPLASSSKPRSRSRSAPAAALAWTLAATLLALPSPRASHAQSDFPSGLKTVAGVRIEGRRHVPSKELWTVMKTRRPSIFPWRDRPVIRTDFLEADVRAIEQVHRAHGFLDAHAQYDLTPARDERAVFVVFTVEEGPRSTVRSVELAGVAALGADAIRKKLYLKPGHPFNPSAMIVDTARISILYKDRGMLPHVTASARRESLSVDVRYEVEEGPVYRNGQVSLSGVGAGDVPQRLARRELLMKPGDVFRISKVQRSLERLYETGLYSQAQITPLPDSSHTLVDFDVRVRERKPRWIDAGVGSGTSERFRFTGEWGHRSLLGRGIQGALAARLAFDGNARFLLSRAEASLLEPWLLRSRTRGLVSVYVEERHERSDTLVLKQRPVGVRFQLRREIGRWSRVALTEENIYMTEDQEVLDPLRPPAPLPRHYTTRRLVLGYDRDTREDPINPVRGSVQSLSGEIAGGPLAGASSFTKAELVSSWYTPLARGWVLATRLRAGAIDPFGNQTFAPDASIDEQVARVPIEDRFRIGGVNTIRGYDENQLPGSGVGGLALLLGNVELRIPIAGPFGIETFVDAGNVWDRPAYLKLRKFRPRAAWQADPSDVRYQIGAGLRVNLPFGPLRVDFTQDPDPQNHKRWSPQFAIGPTF